MSKVGVFVCECGPNIAEKIDVDALVQFAAELEGVSFAKKGGLPCSADGKMQMTDDIKAQELERVVVVGCTPREHEKTFMDVAEGAGMNPFLVHMVNIREQVAWVVPDPEAALQKAKSLVRAGVRRVLLNQPLEKQEMEAESTAVVLGAGVAGMEAALVLAQKNRKVYVLEKDPCVGGHANQYEEVFPAMECGSCMLEPKLDTLLHSDNIEVLTYSEIEEVLGFYGNFTIKVKKKARSVVPEACFGCDECMKACPVKDIPNKFTQGFTNRSAIYIPYPGALPFVAVIDRDHCLRFKGQECSACADACPFGAVDFTQQDETIEINAGSVVLAPGFTQFDCTRIPTLGYKRIPEVYTGLEFETLLSSSGPTEGELLMKNGDKPKSIAFLHCIGSRSQEFNSYCSGTCCMYTMKFGHLARKKLPEAEIFDVHANLSIPGKGYFELFQNMDTDGIKTVRTPDPNKVDVKPVGNRCMLTVPAESGPPRTMMVDMVVLAAGIEPAEDTERLSELFGVPLDNLGFFEEQHGRLGSVSTNIEGVQVAGCAQGPKDIQQAVVQGAAAAGKILGSLVPGEKIELSSITAQAMEELCGGCKVCIPVCPYRAIAYDAEERRATVNEALCKGCGTCASACGSGAMQARHFTRDQISAEIEGVL